MRVEGVEVLKFSGEGGSAESGGRDSPRRATSFLVRDKKGGKETRPTACGPCGANLRRCACGVRRITHYAAAQLRSDKCGESDHEAGVSFGTPATPQAPRRRRSQKGGGRVGPSLRSASGSQAQAPRAGKPSRAQRRGRRQQGRFSFGYFSLAKQRTSTSPAGARPGLRPQQSAQSPQGPVWDHPPHVPLDRHPLPPRRPRVRA